MDAKAIQDWLINQLSEITHIPPDTVDIQEPFAQYGLSSRDAVTLSGDLEDLLQRQLSPTLAYEYPSIEALSRFLSSEAGAPGNSGNTLTAPLQEPIAVIGMGCRFPGAPDIRTYWQMLRDGVDAITEIPEDRWPKEDFYHPDPAVPGKSISRWGGFLDRIDTFDPAFFGISPMEAKYMDPQQRLLQELSFEAIDDAGYNKDDLHGSKTGVFIGISISEYSQLQFDNPSLITSHSGTGSALSIAANRISYYYNFHGPSIAIDTACSSSLAAVHLACQSLRNGESSLALAGGVNLILSPAHSIAFTKAGVLAPDGRCKTFDARANGYVRGEGGGIVVLKLLSAALADGDTIHALIRGSAMSQDGKTNGLIAPSPEAQEILLRDAYKAAGIAPENVRFVEAHGTGTLLGDSMEARALGAVLGQNRLDGPCIIGSVKSNFGHLEAAAGIAGLIKVVLSLKHRSIPPSLHYQTPNPHIPFEKLHLQVQNTLNGWPATAGSTYAGVSSFGFGGTNVHVVLGEADTTNGQKSPAPASYLLPLSASSPEALHTLASDFGEILAADFSRSTQDICLAAGIRRSRFACRMALTGNTRQELYAGLLTFLQETNSPHLASENMTPDRPPALAFVFSGQGGQWQGMGRDLLETEPVFLDTLEKIDQLTQVYCSWSLLDVLRAEQHPRLDDIDVIQPVIFAIQVGIARMLESWGIRADAVTGHSMGEVAAAHIAGILTLDDAVKTVCVRSRLLRSVRGQGGMLATGLSPQAAKDLVENFADSVAVAVINGPSSTVLSGQQATLNSIAEALQRQNIFCKPVNVDVASHSPQMELIRTELLQILEELQPKVPEIPVYSTVTGTRGNNLDYHAGYWMDNLRKPVLFSETLERLLDDDYSAFIEIGPHPLLLGVIQQALQARRQKVICIPSMRRDEAGREVLLKTLATLYSEGVAINWQKLYPHGVPSIPLPPIRWERQRYWIDDRPTASEENWRRFARYEKDAHPLLGSRLDLANAIPAMVWQNLLDLHETRFLEDHRVDTEILFPASAYMEIAVQAARENGLSDAFELLDGVFTEGLTLHAATPVLIQTHVIPEPDNRFTCNIFSKNTPEENWVQHALVTVSPVGHAENGATQTALPDLNPESGWQQIEAETFYQILLSKGLDYGPVFRGVQQIWLKDTEAWGRIHLPVSLSGNIDDHYYLHPALLDACLQLIAAPLLQKDGQDLFLPVGYERLRVFARPEKQVWSRAVLLPASDGTHLTADISIFNENGQKVAELYSFKIQRIGKRAHQLQAGKNLWQYRIAWQAKELPGNTVPAASPAKRWLILADMDGLGESLARQLEAGGDTCQLIPFKELIQQLDSNRDADYYELIDEYIDRTPVPLHGVVHLWSTSTRENAMDAGTDGPNTALLGPDSILLLIQALAKRPAGMPKLWLVTRGAQAVASAETVAIEQSTVWGIGKVISFELPELHGVRVDLDPRQLPENAASMLLRQVLQDDREDQIAFRGGLRYVQRLVPYKQSEACKIPSIPFKNDGTYLITGGLGGLGLATASWMIQRGARHLVLMGRNAPSPDAGLALDQMRALGAEILIVQADVSDREQVKTVFAKIEGHMPLLRGIIHAAGILDDGALLHLDRTRMHTVMAPKVNGAWNLHEASAGHPLDFFVLFSSAVSVLGSPGQGNYAAASAYIDALAFYRQQLGLPAISINWGPWADVGLAAEALERLKEQQASTQHLIKVIQIKQGLDMLEQLLNAGVPQVVVLPFDLKNLLELYPAAASMPFFSEVGGSDTHVGRLYARPNLRQPYTEPRDDMERKLAALWRQTLHIDKIGVHDSFFELGGDSVLAAQILTLTQKTYGIRINPQDAFKAFTIERLAEMLKTEILSQLEEMSEEDALKRLSENT